MADKLSTPPPPTNHFLLSFPRPYVLLVTINREKAMNSIPMSGHWEGQRIWKWLDNEPNLRVAVITGKGTKSFSAGADLMEQKTKQREREAGNSNNSNSSSPDFMPESGFMGVSMRTGKKPIIAAVNGYALGGGFEIALNCDMVVASPTATFGLPEAKRGLYAGAGGLPRVVRNFGMQLATEIVLGDRVLSAKEVEHFGFARVAASPGSVVEEALDLADKVGSMSPDAVVISRAGLRETWETASVERGHQIVRERYGEALMKGENLKIGLQAFAMKKKPEWVPSKM